MPPN
jgi:coatomer subunit beta